jgi:hypothetical protein
MSAHATPTSPQDAAFPDWNALYDVIAPGSEERRRPAPGFHPPLDDWRWQNGNAEYPRRDTSQTHVLALPPAVLLMHTHHFLILPSGHHTN